MESIPPNKSVVDTPYAWFVTFAAFLCYSVGTGCYGGTTGVFFSAFLEEFDTDRSATAVVSALSSVGFLGGGIVTSYLTSRWGYRVVVIIGALALGASFFVTSFCTSIEPIYLAQGLTKGLAISFVMQPLFVVISEYHNKRRSLAMSIIACGAGVGLATIASLSQWLISDLGWRWACRILGSLFSIVGCMAALTFAPIGIDSTTNKRSVLLKHGELFNILAFRYFSLGVLFYAVFLTANSTFLVNYAESKGITPAKAAGLWTYWGISTVAGRLSGGLIKSTSKSRLREFCSAMMGMGIITMLLAFSSKGYPNYIVFVVFQICSGWLQGKFYHLSALCAGDVFGVENVSVVMGWFFTCQMPLGVSAPIILGFVTDRSGGNYAPAFLIAAVMQTLSGFLMLSFWRHGRLIIRTQEARPMTEEDMKTTSESGVIELL